MANYRQPNRAGGVCVYIFVCVRVYVDRKWWWLVWGQWQERMVAMLLLRQRLVTAQAFGFLTHCSLKPHTWCICAIDNFKSNDYIFHFTIIMFLYFYAFFLTPSTPHPITLHQTTLCPVASASLLNPAPPFSLNIKHWTTAWPQELKGRVSVLFTSLRNTTSLSFRTGPTTIYKKKWGTKRYDHSEETHHVWHLFHIFVTIKTMARRHCVRQGIL